MSIFFLCVWKTSRTNVKTADKRVPLLGTQFFSTIKTAVSNTKRRIVLLRRYRWVEFATRRLRIGRKYLWKTCRVKLFQRETVCSINGNWELRTKPTPSDEIALGHRRYYYCLFFEISQTRQTCHARPVRLCLRRVPRTLAPPPPRLAYAYFVT